MFPLKLDCSSPYSQAIEAMRCLELSAARLAPTVASDG
jgi:hypothetical protein